jgi:hypothetical protein
VLRAVSGLLAHVAWPCHCFGAGEQHMASIALTFPTLSPSYQPYHWLRLREGPDLRQFEELFQTGGVVGSIPLAHGLTIATIHDF